jgi:uroporphyrinogen decarboxylase
MTPRQRVLSTVRHQQPDRVPFNIRLDDAVVERFKTETRRCDGDHEAYFQYDLRRVGIRLPARPKDMPRPDWMPHPTTEAITECAGIASRLREQGLATYSGYVCGVFEEAKFWLGDVDTLTLPYDDPARMGTILDRITEYKMVLYGAYAHAGVDIVHIGDDLGAQSSLIMSPEQYRRWYRPRHEQIIEHLRSINPDVLIAFHCCGHVTPLLGDLIDLGVDILEAVQPEAMDIGELKQRYGQDITFWGGIGNQSVLARLKPDEVVESVGATLAVMKPGGGYLASPCHTITEDIPWENVTALVRAIQQYGGY